MARKINDKITCDSCGKLAKNSGRRLCGKCYWVKRRQKPILRSWSGDYNLKLDDVIGPEESKPARPRRDYDQCIDCHRWGQIKGRDRCKSCYNRLIRSDDVDILYTDLDEENSRYMENKRDGIEPEPTDCPPGSYEKIAVMRKRAEMCIDLFCSEDRGSWEIGENLMKTKSASKKSLASKKKSSGSKKSTTTPGRVSKTSGRNGTGRAKHSGDTSATSQ